MNKQKAIEALEQRVAILLEHADKLRSLIDGHEFDMAAMEANALAMYCKGANQFANRIADAE